MGPGVRRDDVRGDAASLVLPLIPPRKIVGHISRYLVLELRRRFSRNDTRPLSRPRSARAHRCAAIDLVGFHRIVGSQHPPSSAGSAPPTRRGLGGDFAGERTRGRQQLVRRHHLADEAAASAPAPEIPVPCSTTPVPGRCRRCAAGTSSKPLPARCRAGRTRIEPGIFGCNADVHRSCMVTPMPTAGPFTARSRV